MAVISPRIFYYLIFQPKLSPGWRFLLHTFSIILKIDAIIDLLISSESYRLLADTFRIDYKASELFLMHLRSLGCCKFKRMFPLRRLNAANSISCSFIFSCFVFWLPFYNTQLINIWLRRCWRFQVCQLQGISISSFTVSMIVCKKSIWW